MDLYLLSINYLFIFIRKTISNATWFWMVLDDFQCIVGLCNFPWQHWWGKFQPTEAFKFPGMVHPWQHKLRMHLDGILGYSFGKWDHAPLILPRGPSHPSLGLPTSPPLLGSWDCKAHRSHQSSLVPSPDDSPTSSAAAGQKLTTGFVKMHSLSQDLQNIFQPPKIGGRTPKSAHFAVGNVWKHIFANSPRRHQPSFASNLVSTGGAQFL